MFGSKRIILIGLFAGLTVVMLSSSVQADGPINDISDGVNDTLFGGSNLFAAQAILTAAVMMAAGLVLAMARLPTMAIIIVLFCVLGALTAIGWANVTIMLIAVMVFVALFVKRVTEYFTGQGGGADEG